ncbi:hypothetical protein VIGAN_04104200 [Vigna angularis var. angularis]|uniref:F-box domain-containing protein n=2 Tax=Vigna angularis var. angularis TaxID=157739 RepID=A0A0S3RTD0_PHAAN|nr:hypothetical protein VIGAN_04104200 [Vigna angularis var. angularis]
MEKNFWKPRVHKPGKVEEVEMATQTRIPSSSQDPNSNRDKIPKISSPTSTTPQGRKKLPSSLQKLKNVEDKRAETLEKELDALFRNYKKAMAEKVYVELSQCGGSRNAVIAVLLEESDLPLSKLVEEIHDRLNEKVGSGAIVLAEPEPVTYATVKTIVLLEGHRVTYGLPNADANVSEDYTESCLWCWETKNLELLPQSVRGQVGVRRMCRRRIHDRIIAVSETIEALKRVRKVSTNLSRTIPEADIRSLVDSWRSNHAQGKREQMENMESTFRKKQKVNNDLIYDILVKIFLSLNVVDVAVASLVCKSWNNACRDPSLWNKIDLSRLRSYCFNIPFNKVGAYRHSSLQMNQFLKHLLDLSNGNTTYIIFNFYVYLTNEQFIMVAQRTPNLKRVVLPKTGDFLRAGVDTVLSLWRGLESITTTSAVSNYYMILAIGKHYNNITVLKFSDGNFEEKHALAMTKYIPKLKILSIRHLIISWKALLCVLNFLEDLEKVNICNSLILDTAYPRAFVEMSELKDLLPTSSMEKLIYCETGTCLRCMNGRDTTRSRQPDGPLEDIWGEDEIASLVHLPQPSEAERFATRHVRVLPS